MSSSALPSSKKLYVKLFDSCIARKNIYTHLALLKYKYTSIIHFVRRFFFFIKWKDEPSTAFLNLIGTSWSHVFHTNWVQIENISRGRGGGGITLSSSLTRRLKNVKRQFLKTFCIDRILLIFSFLHFSYLCVSNYRSYLYQTVRHLDILHTYMHTDNIPIYIETY